MNMPPHRPPAGLDFPGVESTVGHTPLVRLQRIVAGTGNTILAKLEGNNPAGSVKDRPALSMIRRAEERGEIRPGDTLIEATSGNTGIALAMVAAMRGYRMVLIMPAHMSEERKLSMSAYGAELIEVSREGGMEAARDLALAMQAAGKGRVLDQFANPDNPRAHYETTGPEIWEQTGGRITHFISSMGTTGTIMGVSRFLKEKNPAIRIVGLQPGDGASIPGIRRWPEAYLPRIFERERVDEVLDIGQQEAESTMRRLAQEEGILCGVSSGGSIAGALRIAAKARDAVIVAIVCDRGDRYLSTGVFRGA
jgi:cysteine synthase B